ncbi:hypothetical protein IWQ60_005459 [Tieghemiomyces parasiticus]|uniref:FAD dependent oxidoreductase domain-containing protein n=1 Tax=Tieghemiomyces parasiticus TaxID=78921 RepID=A0A9W8ABQ9_9FUNG|nr:hypothetical protein IWQ60_005459 [Tieghemiomyces parasiticus]
MDPGLPHPCPLTSYWLERNPLKVHRTTPDLPSSADVVIIGSGIAGAAAAYHLLAQAQQVEVPLQLVLLEAREACSGATGRNGGHIIPIHSRYFNDRVAAAGLETTVQTTQFEHQTMLQILDFIKRYQVDCELRPNGCVLSCKDTKEWSTIQADLRAMRDANVDLPTEVWDAQECRQHLKSMDFVGAIKIPGCQLWPAKLVWAILEVALRQGLNLQTYTPVTQVIRPPVSNSQDPKAAKDWAVRTPRGVIRARHVIHCTNAWAGHLLPQLAPYLRPVRAQVIASARFRTPLLWPFGISFNHGFDYTMQRPDRMVIFGGMRYATPNMEVGVADDSTVNQQLVRAHRLALNQLARTHIATPDVTTAPTTTTNPKSTQVNVENAWTGIMAFSHDALPWVGPLDGLDASLRDQYACVAFNGDGMPRAFRCAEIVARMVINRVSGRLLLPTDDLVPAFLPSARRGVDPSQWDILADDHRFLCQIGIPPPTSHL